MQTRLLMGMAAGLSLILSACAATGPQTDTSAVTAGVAGPIEREMPPEPAHRRIVDIPYHQVDGVDPNLLSLDLYIPEDTARDRPVMVMIHGGGWRRGDKASPNIVGAKMRHFVSEGYIYASINYRLSPMEEGDAPLIHPVHTMDSAMALAWIADNIARFGGDPDRIHLMGHSAGGHIAALLGTNERFLAANGKELSLIKTNVLLDPAALDLSTYLERVGGRGMSTLYQNTFGTDAANILDASPYQHIERGKSLPPTLIFHAGNRMALDVFAPAFASAMTAAGAPSRAVDTVDLTHRELNVLIGMKHDPMTALIMQMHAGVSPLSLPEVIAPSSTESAN